MDTDRLLRRGDRHAQHRGRSHQGGKFRETQSQQLSHADAVGYDPQCRIFNGRRHEYLPADPDPARPTVAAQTDDPHSLLSYTRGLLALRAATPALGTSGDWRYVSDPNHPYPMVYAREYAGEKYIVVLNPSAQRATAQFPEEGAVADIVYGSGVPARYTVRKDLASVKAEPVSATVLRMK